MEPEAGTAHSQREIETGQGHCQKTEKGKEDTISDRLKKNRLTVIFCHKNHNIMANFAVVRTMSLLSFLNLISSDIFYCC